MTKALIVTDLQKDFLPGGSLAVAVGDRIIDQINRLIPRFDTVVLTQDWHPADHVSFCVNHPGASLYSVIETENGAQVMWPEHCVQGSAGAEIDSRIDRDRACAVVRKGMHTNCDSYSAFLEADRKTTTGLDGYLKSRNVTEVFVAGLATDFCVSWTALDAAKFGFKSSVVMDASAAIDVNGSLALAQSEWKKNGVAETTVEALLAIL